MMGERMVQREECAWNVGQIEIPDRIDWTFLNGTWPPVGIWAADWRCRSPCGCGCTGGGLPPGRPWSGQNVKNAPTMASAVKD